jgi:lipopolysaccharide transport system permease protein
LPTGSAPPRAIYTTLLLPSPIFFPASALPDRYRGLLELKPLIFRIEQAGAVMVLDRLPSFSRFALYALGALAISLIGFAWFQKTRRGFADVL